jgi:hypothetical protein
MTVQERPPSRFWGFLAGNLFVVAFAAACPPLHAEDWMFRRSYFSHRPPEGAEPVWPIPESRSAYRTAYYRDGFGVSTGFRWNNYVIQNGARVDRTWYQEGWIEFIPPGP